MPRKCVVQGCSSKASNTSKSNCHDKIRFFSIPAGLDPRYPLDSLILEQRRELWCARLNLNGNEITKNTVVCQFHFSSGKPAYYTYTDNQDWAPSLLLNQNCSSKESRIINNSSKNTSSGSSNVTGTQSNNSAPNISTVENDTRSNNRPANKAKGTTKMDMTLDPSAPAASNSSPAKSRIRVACTCPNCKDGKEKRVGENKRKIHICHHEGCGKVYWRTFHLRVHLRLHNGDRPYFCSWDGCCKQFTRSDEFQRHKLIHTREHRFQCPVCDKRFLRKDHFSQHIKIHSISRGADPAVDEANQIAFTESLEEGEGGRVLPLILRRRNRKKIKSTN